LRTRIRRVGPATLLHDASHNLIDAIRHNQTSDPAFFWRLIALRNELDSVIDDLYRQQLADRKVA
jgi:hypothetical protein